MPVTQAASGDGCRGERHPSLWSVVWEACTAQLPLPVWSVESRGAQLLCERHSHEVVCSRSVGPDGEACPRAVHPQRRGSWREAVMDVTISWPLTAAVRLLDVTLRSAHSDGVGAQAGSASARAVQDKLQRYGNGVEPVVVEVGGRMPGCTLDTLKRIAADSSTGTRPHARRGARIRAHCLRQLLEWKN